MITKNEAMRIADEYLIALEGKIGKSLKFTQVDDESFGWVFYYQSMEYVETGKMSAMLGGNAPFIVDGESGRVHVLGTARPPDVYIKEYAQARLGHSE